MYKRLIALVLLAAMLLLAGCQSAPTAKPQTPEGAAIPTDNTFHAGTDSPFPYIGNTTTTQMAESETGYYIAAGHFLVYVDKFSKVAAPMCQKPGCLHQNEPDKYVRQECDAYIQPGMEFFGVFYDNGYVYVTEQSGYLYDGNPPDGRWLEQITLVRMNPDGSDRTALFSFEEGDVWAATIHRGRFYYQKYNTWIYSYPLDKINAQPELEFYEEHITVYDFFAYGNRLYLHTEDAVASNRTMKVLDLTTKDVTVIPFLDNMNYYTWAAVCGDELFLFAEESYQVWAETHYTRSGIDKGLYRADLDGTNVKKVDVEKFTGLVSDGKYIYQIFRRQDLLTEEWSIDYLAVYNKDMQEVCRVGGSILDVPGYRILTARFAAMQDGSILMWTLYSPEDKERDAIYVYYVLDREDIEAGKLAPRALYSFGRREYGYRND